MQVQEAQYIESNQTQTNEDSKIQEFQFRTPPPESVEKASYMNPTTNSQRRATGDLSPHQIRPYSAICSKTVAKYTNFASAERLTNLPKFYDTTQRKWKSTRKGSANVVTPLQKTLNNATYKEDYGLSPSKRYFKAAVGRLAATHTCLHKPEPRYKQGKSLDFSHRAGFTQNDSVGMICTKKEPNPRAEKQIVYNNTVRRVRVTPITKKIDKTSDQIAHYKKQIIQKSCQKEDLKARIQQLKQDINRVNAYFYKRKANQEGYDQAAKNLDAIKGRTKQQRVLTQKDIEVTKKQVSKFTAEFNQSQAKCQKMAQRVYMEQQAIQELKTLIQNLNLRNSRVQEERDVIGRAVNQSDKQLNHLKKTLEMINNQGHQFQKGIRENVAAD